MKKKKPVISLVVAVALLVAPATALAKVDMDKSVLQALEAMQEGLEKNQSLGASKKKETSEKHISQTTATGDKQVGRKDNETARSHAPLVVFGVDVEQKHSATLRQPKNSNPKPKKLSTRAVTKPTGKPAKVVSDNGTVVGVNRSVPPEKSKQYGRLNTNAIVLQRPYFKSGGKFVIPFKGENLCVSRLTYHPFLAKSGELLAIDLFGVKPWYKGDFYREEIPTGLAQEIISAKHFHADDLKLYGKPFIRLVVIFKKPISYRVEQQRDKLVVIFKETGRGTTTMASTGESIANKLKKEGKRFTVVYPAHRKNADHDGSSPISRKEVAYTVETSLKNISAIVSPYTIQEVFYSKEDGIQVKAVGNTVFIKPLPKQVFADNGVVYKYNSSPKDIYILTPERLYSLNLIPKDIPSVTYYLATKKSVSTLPASQLTGKGLRAQQRGVAEPFIPSGSFNEVSEVKADSYVATLLSLIKAAYYHNVPSGYIAYPFGRTIHYRELTLEGKFKYIGDKYVLYAYRVIAKQRVSLDNSQFIYLVGSPLAVDIVKPKLGPGETTMLFIVAGKEGE